MNELNKLQLKESFDNCEIFRQQSKENQRFDLLELTSALIEYAKNVKKDCKYLENKIDTIRDSKLLNDDINHNTNIYGSLSYHVMQVEKKFSRLNSFMEIYLKDKI
jgi:hypothetical protein